MLSGRQTIVSDAAAKITRDKPLSLMFNVDHQANEDNTQMHKNKMLINFEKKFNERDHQ
jgi:hypothetical protein